MRGLLRATSKCKPIGRRLREHATSGGKLFDWPVRSWARDFSLPKPQNDVYHARNCHIWWLAVDYPLVPVNTVVAPRRIFVTYHQITCILILLQYSTTPFWRHVCMKPDEAQKAEAGCLCIKMIYWTPWEIVKAVSLWKDSVTTGRSRRSLCKSKTALLLVIDLEHGSRSEQFLDKGIGCSGSRLNRKNCRGLYTELFYAIIPVLFPYFYHSAIRISRNVFLLLNRVAKWLQRLCSLKSFSSFAPISSHLGGFLGWIMHFRRLTKM